MGREASRLVSIRGHLCPPGAELRVSLNHSLSIHQLKGLELPHVPSTPSPRIPRGSAERGLDQGYLRVAVRNQGGQFPDLGQ